MIHDLKMAYDLIIAAPFGNWTNFCNTTKTRGTYTLRNRGGIAYRAWRCLRTLRYNWRAKAWINKLGLPNPGIASLDGHYPSDIISIFGFDKDEWRELAKRVMGNRPLAVELNLSCPNVNHDVFIGNITPAIDILLEAGIPIIAKLPPIKWMKLAGPLHTYGVNIFHCCNTIPTPGGGLSGKPLKQYSLWAVEEIKQKYGDSVILIGGGGIDTATDAVEFYAAGANHVSIGSTLLNPFNWKNVEEIANAKRKKNHE